VIASQLTPLYWQKVLPGETFNLHNHLGMGKVWFTVSCSPFDAKNEPTAAGVAASIAAIAVSTPLILPALVYGGAAALTGGAAIALAGTVGGAALASAGVTAGGLAGAGVVVGAVGTAAVAGGAAGASSIIQHAKSIVGVKKDGVYSDGSTLFVRGRLNDAGAYALFYADDAERAASPYTAPSAEEIAAFGLAIAAAEAEAARAAAAAAASPEARVQAARIASASNGIQVKNETAVPLLVILSQLTPLYWGRVEPGEVWNIGNEKGVGRVWFTVGATIYTKESEPTTAGVGIRLAATTAAIVGGPVVAAVGALVAAGGLGAGMQSVASVRGVSKTGVYADGKLLTVRGITTPGAGGAGGAGGAYELHFASVEELERNPWAGPPAPEQLKRLQDALDAARGSAGGNPAAAAAPAAAGSEPSGAAAEPAEAVSDYTDVVLRSVGPGPAGLSFRAAGEGDAAVAFSDIIVREAGPDAVGVPAGASLVVANGSVLAGMPFAEAHRVAQAALAACSEQAPLELRFRFVEQHDGGGGEGEKVETV
jgi:hypothetical protein